MRTLIKLLLYKKQFDLGPHCFFFCVSVPIPSIITVDGFQNLLYKKQFDLGPHCFFFFLRFCTNT